MQSNVPASSLDLKFHKYLSRDIRKTMLTYKNHKFLIYFPYCQNPNLTSTQHLGLTWKWLCKPHPTHPTHHRNSMSAISQLLLTRLWWNFKGRLLGTSRTDSNCQGDICPRNICPCDICPYQEYLSCYWPDFDETLQVRSWEQL